MVNMPDAFILKEYYFLTINYFLFAKYQSYYFGLSAHNQT